MHLFSYVSIFLCSIFQILHGKSVFESVPPNKIIAENGTTFFDQFSETDRNQLELVIQHDGYAAEAHELYTEDGFKIMLQRIKAKGKEKKNREPILMVHGMMMHAAAWLHLPPGYNLAYKISDLGYDVWLYNQRGKPTSNGRVRLQPEDPEYYNWGPDEIGRFDVPNTIDYVLKVTEKKKLSIIGHSLGCAVSFMALIDRSKYNAKVRLIIALGPEFTAALSEGGPIWKTLDTIINFVQSMNLHALANSELIMGINANNLLFSNTSVGDERRAASSLLAKLLGFDISSPKENEANSYRSLTINNGRMSRKVLMHVDQMGTSGNIAKFDYGEQKNLLVYKTKSPPLYDFRKLNVPIHIFYSLGDRAALPEPIVSHCKKLKDLKRDVHCIEIPDTDFGHSDFVGNIKAKDLVYEEVIAILSRK